MELGNSSWNTKQMIRYLEKNNHGKIFFIFSSFHFFFSRFFFSNIKNLFIFNQIGSFQCIDLDPSLYKLKIPSIDREITTITDRICPKLHQILMKRYNNHSVSVATQTDSNIGVYVYQCMSIFIYLLLFISRIKSDFSEKIRLSQFF